MSLRIPWFFFAGVLPACAGFFPGAFAGGPNAGITGGRAGARAANPNEGWPNERGEPPRFRVEVPKIMAAISVVPGAGPSSQ